MICNKVLLALAALIAVAAAIPFFPIDTNSGTFDREYEDNANLWGNAPLKAIPQQGGQGAEVPDAADDADVDEVDTEIEVNAPEIAAGDASSAEVADPAAGGAIGGADGGNSNEPADSPDATGAAVNTGAIGANAGAPRGDNAPIVADETNTGGNSVHAAGGPPPGQLKSNNSQGKGLGIAVGVVLLVVATAAVAVFAIRQHRRYRF